MAFLPIPHFYLRSLRYKTNTGGGLIPIESRFLYLFRVKVQSSRNKP